jgi:aminoglycoside phosphotransferase (APT) family kinase protein
VSELFVRRERPKRAVVNRVLQVLYPESKLGRISRLRGGLSNHMFSAQYRAASGDPGRIVLRMTTDWERSASENARREYTTLLRVREAGVLAPQPLMLDEAGDYLGRPGLVTSFEGRTVENPRRPGPWLRGLAQAVATLHEVTPDRVDLTHLSRQSEASLRRKIEQGLPEGLRHDVLALEMQTSLERGLKWGPECLIHDDYWPGNVVWRRGRVGAIVDWTTAVVGDAREDVAQCRLDLAATHSMAYADSFTREYEAATGRTLKDVWFFDLRRGVTALDSFRSWIPGYVDSGLTYMTEELMETRLRAFLRAALENAR